MSMRLGDPLTTRFINGTIDVAFPRGVKILTYSPKGKGLVTGIIEQGGDAISIFPHLEFLASSWQGIKNQPDTQEKAFGIMVGPEKKLPAPGVKKPGTPSIYLPVHCWNTRECSKKSMKCSGKCTLLCPARILKLPEKRCWRFFPLLSRHPKISAPSLLPV